LSNIHCRAWDGRRLGRRQATFDGVLVDAPCTCSGTWRRNPDARWSTRPEEVTEMAELQARLLANAASGVKPGGVLVYATCSLFEAENGAVVREFLARREDYRLEPFGHPLTGRDTPGWTCIWPWEGDCDAMFVARLRHQPRTENRTT
jgi:16S rRNA (cytosine967-C5)-methyltransferase